MASKKKLLQAAAGSAGGAGLDVDEVFSTYLYDGNGVGNSIENGINLGNDTEERVLLNLSGDTLTDTGPNTLTVTNNSVSVNTSTKKYGTGSLRFNGSATATVTDSTLILGTSDFTIEFWLYLDSLSLKGILNIGNPSDHTDYSIGVYVDGNGAITAQYRNTPNNMGQFSTSAATANMSAATWHHVAIVRHNNTLSAYLDGSVIGTDDIGGTTVGWNQLELGTHWGTSGGDDYRFTGYIDDFRISKKAVYTANFTAPSSAHSTSYTSTTGEGGLVWTKSRSAARNHSLHDSARGVTCLLKSNGNNAQYCDATQMASFSSNGFTIGSDGSSNTNGDDYCSWTFRKAPKFFDVVTYTGTGSAQNISHNLGSVPGMIIVKQTSGTKEWRVYHRGIDSSAPEDYYVVLNSTNARVDNAETWNDTAPTSTVFSVGSGSVTNQSGQTYVAYLFAHNDGDGEFGPDSNQDIIKCGSYTGNGTEQEINLGFEAQWVMIKRTDGTGRWFMFDSMRGVVSDENDAYLRANGADAENTTNNWIKFTPTGFTLESGDSEINGGASSYIYMAIRRGPLAEPESATDVFAIDYANGSDVPAFYSGFPADMGLFKQVTGTSTFRISSRLTEGRYLETGTTSAEQANSNYVYDYQDGFFAFALSSAYLGWMWKRAPSYFDVVTYTGTGSARTISHNLGVAPEMMWVKRRDATASWVVYHKGLNGGTTPEDYVIELNNSSGEYNNANWNDTAPTSSVFSLGTANSVNNSSGTYIAYLFATLAGVSKVGSYTGNDNGSNSQVIDCGFSSGARFVLIKLTSTNGYDWYVFDTERGIVAGDDPYLLLNTTGAEQTVSDMIDPNNSGFEVTGSTLNVSGASYIFYAIA